MQVGLITGQGVGAPLSHPNRTRSAVQGCRRCYRRSPLKEATLVAAEMPQAWGVPCHGCGRVQATDVAW